MISKLPKWVWFFAFLFAAVAGMVNAVGMLSFQRQAVTHLTGNATLFATSLATLDFPALWRVGAVIGAFFAGAAISGFIIQDNVLQLGRRYGVALLLESILLCLAAPALRRHSVLGFDAAACACGIQNAMASAYSGTVVRTTHLSGMFTDLGIYLGHGLRGVPVDERRATMCACVIGGFVSGGILGALAFNAVGFSALYLPASVTAASTLAYWGYLWQNRKRQAAT